LVPAWLVSRSRALARAGREVVVVEAEDAIGTGMSSRNSEVIHAGIYYATGLAKTRLCVEGKVMLYRFCREYGVQHRRSGKLIVAADESEIAKLAALEVQAKANGVDDLLWLSGAEVRARAGAEGEPGAAFALDRHRRQSRPDAGAQG
jgi:L-2-hydroxyglutarate oxidase LhgO